ncbi:hypothetical protein Bbelb_051350 [Branchiostoma belcheri]|nr:hypothetical protein Bbelb_051350 [Branchiostoma belcheri]
MDYMEREWLGNSVWSVDEWSVYFQPIRTNNDLEGYHTRLNKKAQNSLDFYLLVELLCKEAEYVNIQAKMPPTGCARIPAGDGHKHTHESGDLENNQPRRGTRTRRPPRRFQDEDFNAAPSPLPPEPPVEL